MHPQSTSLVSDITLGHQMGQCQCHFQSHHHISDDPSSEFEIEHFFNGFFMILGLKSSLTSLTHVHTVVMLGYLRYPERVNL